MNVLSVVCALLSQCWNATDMLERSWKWSPCLEFWILYQRFGGQVDDFFRHLLAEIFGAISLCSFWKGRLKENHLSAVTGRGVDRIYIYIRSRVQECPRYCYPGISSCFEDVPGNDGKCIKSRFIDMDSTQNQCASIHLPWFCDFGTRILLRSTSFC
jgi:hypothetical protein